MITRYQHLFVQPTVGYAPITDLAAVENLVESPLPRDFADFLLAAQGGLLFYELPLPGKNRVLPFHMILELGAEQHPHRPITIAGWTKRARDMGAPASFILFGGNPLRGRWLYFDAPPGSGRILLGSDGSTRFTTAAATFEQYVQALRLNHDSIRERLMMCYEYENRDPRGLPEMLQWLDAAVPDWRVRYEVPDDALRQ